MKAAVDVLFIIYGIWNSLFFEQQHSDYKRKVSRIQQECTESRKHYNYCKIKEACRKFNDCCLETNRTISKSDIGSIIKNLPDWLIQFDPYNVGAKVKYNLGSPFFKCRTSDEQAGNDSLSLRVPNSTWKNPTVQKFKALHNNFDPQVANPDRPTSEEIREQHEFLDVVLKSAVMNATYHFLNKNKIFCGDRMDFRYMMYEIWFGLYDRDGKQRERTLGSNGFEHVFLGEIKRSKIIGFHNWIFFSLEELAGRLRNLGPRVKPKHYGNYGFAVANNFVWQGRVKCFGSMMVGTTPEFEMALYTICFFVRPDRSCKLRFQGKKLTIQTYGINFNGKRLIGSAFLGL